MERIWPTREREREPAADQHLERRPPSCFPFSDREKVLARNTEGGEEDRERFAGVALVMETGGRKRSDDGKGCFRNSALKN